MLQSAAADTLAELAIAALVWQLDANSRIVTLVLDDYHTINHPAIHDGLARLLHHLPRALSLVIASRTEPPLPLARLRVRGLIHEIRAADLAFRVDEAEALFAGIPTAFLTHEEVVALTTQTEGWAASLRLAALMQSEGRRVQTFTGGLSGGQQYVFDYLMDEIFQQQPAWMQHFLLATAYAERLCAPLCHALRETYHAQTGTAFGENARSAQEILEEIEHQGLFLSALDDERHWFRYHHLFATFLRRVVERTAPGLMSHLQHRAGTWFADQALISEAITALVASGDHTTAADLVETHAERTLWEYYDPPTVRSWLAVLPSEIIRTRWRLLIAEILTSLSEGPAQIEATMTSRLDALLHLVPEGVLRDAWLRGEPPPDTSPNDDEIRALLGQLAFIRLNHDRLVQNGQQFAVLSRFAEAWLAEQASIFTPTLTGTNAITAFFHGDIGLAADAYSQMHRQALALGNHATILASMIGTASVQAASGEITSARLMLEQVLREAQRYGLDESTSAAMARARLGQMYYLRNDLTAARHTLEAALAQPWQWWEPESYVPATLTLALTYMAIGQSERALVPLDRLEELARIGHHPEVATIVAVCRARVLLHQHDQPPPALIVDATDGATLRARYAASFLVLRELADLALARVLIAAGNTDAALSLLDELAEQAQLQARRRSLWEIRVLMALAQDAYGQRSAAVKTLAAVLPDLAAAHCMRLVLDEGKAAATLLTAVHAVSSNTATLRRACERILSTFPPTDRATIGALSRTPEDDLPLLVEPISERERAVLELIAAGATTRMIAATLVIAESTVKWHVRNLCGKLQVRTRLQLAARARLLGLLR